MNLLKKFLPNEHVKSVFEITPQFLKEKGIKGIITDLDNTLVAWNQKEATEKVATWFKQLEEASIKITIMSNNNEERVAHFSKPLNIPYIFKAKKPLRASFKRAQDNMQLKNEEIAVIGDQLLTDVFGGNRADLFTILVVPIVKTDGFMTRFNRQVERRIMNYFKRKGLLNWEEQ